jgi:plastocyanin domain-containing protein
MGLTTFINNKVSSIELPTIKTMTSFNNKKGSPQCDIKLLVLMQRKYFRATNQETSLITSELT